MPATLALAVLISSVLVLGQQPAPSSLDAQDAATVQQLYDAKDLDFRLRPGSAAVDRGVALPTITEGFTGRAPDLGALERDRPAPVYGPRPLAR